MNTLWKQRSWMERCRWETEQAVSTRSPHPLPRRLVILCHTHGLYGGFHINKIHHSFKTKMLKELGLDSLQGLSQQRPYESLRRNIQENEYMVVLSSDHHSGSQILLNEGYIIPKEDWTSHYPPGTSAFLVEQMLSFIFPCGSTFHRQPILRATKMLHCSTYFT